MSEFTHRPVLLDECIEGLNIRGEGVYLDGTLGRAGHSEQIVRRLTSGRLICVDRDRAALDAARDGIASRIAAVLDQGRSVAFITLGDPTVYSTYLYIHRRVLAMGYEARLIPGVPSFCAVAAALGTGLCEGSDRLLIVPASHRDVADCLAVDANLVFMKAGRELGALRQKLEDASLLEGAAMVENCGMEGERVFPRFAGAPADSGYFSVVVVKRDGQ